MNVKHTHETRITYIHDTETIHMKNIQHCTHEPNCGQELANIKNPYNNAAVQASHLVEEWHPIRNKCWTLSDYSGSSQKKAWWLCVTCGNEWEASIGNRVRLGSGCPPCGIMKRSQSQKGQIRLSESNMSLGERYPEIAAYWHPTLNNEITAYMIGSFSDKKIWFLCQCGNEYLTTTATKVAKWKKNGKVLCKKCSPAERRVPKTGKSFAEIYPETAKQFDLEKNAPKTPYDYNPRANAYVWWLCDKKHSTYALINSKILGHECNECQVSTKSKIENDFRQLAAKSMILKNVSAESVRVPLAWRKQKVAMLDIVGETLTGTPVAIEYDGEYYHQFSDVAPRDIDKTNALLDAGYLVIRIRERKLRFIAVQHPNLYQISHDYTRRYIREPVSLRETFDKIEQWLKNK